MSERRCRWCYRTVGEIRATIEARGDKEPVRLFDRDDLWARCVLCKPGKSGYRKTHQSAPRHTPVKSQRAVKTPANHNRADPQKPTE